MCGRYVLTQNLAEICAAFQAGTGLGGITAHYNAAPDSVRTVVVKDRLGEAKPCRAGEARWGWPVAPTFSPVINIRSETMGEKAMFAPSVAQGRRCIVPASGFYEWDASGQAFYVHAKDAPLIGLCGLWTRDEQNAVRFAILTRAALPHLAPVHPRMPLAATPQAAMAFLATGALPAPPELEVYPVSQDVNLTQNNHAGLLEPMAAAPQGNLFAAG